MLSSEIFYGFSLFWDIMNIPLLFLEMIQSVFKIKLIINYIHFGITKDSCNLIG